jgi:hypothetical protein
MKLSRILITIIAIGMLLINSNISFAGGGGGITGTNVSCGLSSSQSLTANGFSGSNATSTAGSCGQCCYQGADLDGDGDADVNFSVENAQWYQYCNPSGTTPLTIDFIVDETNNDCNLQGAVFVTSGASSDGATDALDIDCSNQEYSQYGSGVSGNADGFSFTGVTIPAGGCAWLMVDGYGGATCGAFTVNVVCPPLCTNPASFTAGLDQVVCAGSSVTLNSTVSGGTTTAPGLSYSWTPTSGLSCTTCADPVATPTSTTTYTMTACNGGPGFCCVTDQVVVTVTPTFVPNAGPDVTACNGSTVTLGGSPTGPAGSTYLWTIIANDTDITGPSSTTLANPTATLGASPATGFETYQVQVTNGPCVFTDQVTVTIGAIVVNAGLNQEVCAGQTISLGGTPTAPAGSTYAWTEVLGDNLSPTTGNVSVSSASNSNPTLNTTISASGTVTYQVAASLPGCSAVSDQVIVTINPLPPAPAVTTPAAICAGQNASLVVTSSTTDLTFSWWTAAAGGTQVGTGAPLSVAPTSTTTYYAQATNTITGCVGPRTAVTVTVIATPVATVGADQTVCAGIAVNITSSVANPGACSPAQT